jgi:hypothetical protein
MGLEQVAQQQQAILGNMSASANLEQMLKTEFERQLDTNNSAKVQESAVKKAVEGKSPRLGVEIMANLVNKMAQNVNLPSKLLGNMEKEFNFLFESSSENKQDVIDLSSAISRAPKLGSGNPQGQGSSSEQNPDDGQQTAAPEKVAVQEYVGAYSQMLVTGGGETRKKLDQIEHRLMQEGGMSLKDIQQIKTRVANSVRFEILQQVKRDYLNQVLAKSRSIESLIANRQTQDTVNFAFSSNRLGGYDFGGLDGHLQGAVNRAQGEVHADLADFVNDELARTIAKKALGEESPALEKEIEDLLKLGNKVGFDLNSFLEKIPKLKDDLGLNPLIQTEYVMGDNGTGNSDGQRERSQYQCTFEEEKELLTDKLRALYLRRAVSGGELQSVLESQFKMIKLKNGLIRLGISNFDQVEKEGKALAKVKLFEMLREAFEERATYSKLSGPAWKMTERKIKTVLKNLDRLGIEINDTELNLIRDRANEKMYQVAKQEMEMLHTAIEVHGEVAYLTAKKKMAQEILSRMSEETEGLQPVENRLESSVKEAC